MASHAVAGSVDVLRGRAQFVVHLDTFGRVSHTSLLKIKARHQRYTTHRHQEHIPPEFPILDTDHNFIILLMRASGQAGHKLDPFTGEDLAQRFPSFWILLGQHPLIHQNHL